MSDIRTADLLIRALENEGVKHIFAVPGEENLDVLDAMRNSSIELVLTRHEQGAAFMAATYGRLTGRIGVCMATLGPGATNLVTGAAYAFLGAMPMMMITGQKPIRHSKQGRFQIIDVVRMMEPITKSARQIAEGALIPSAVRDMVRIAEEERPGPVHLELPEDIAASVVEDVPLIPRLQTPPSCAAQSSVDAAIARIRQAKRPLVLIGAAANRREYFEPMRRFIIDLKLPFFNTQMGKGVVSCDTAGFMGTAAMSDNDLIHTLIRQADLIVNVGHDVIEKPPFFMRPNDGCDVIHVNTMAAQADPVYFPQIEVVGDIGDTVERITSALSANLPAFDFKAFNVEREKIATAIHDMDGDTSFPIKPQALVATVRKAMPDEGIIALDNGVYKVWFARNYPTRCPNTVLLDNALATMGAGLPSAMLAAMMDPQRPVMAICGDGGFMMNSQEMETAVRMGLNLTVTVLRDNSYGMIRWKQAAQGLVDWGLEFGNPDFVKYAESYGAKGHRPSSVEETLSCFKQCQSEGGVHLVEVAVDYSENTKI